MKCDDGASTDVDVVWAEFCEVDPASYSIAVYVVEAIGRSKPKPKRTPQHERLWRLIGVAHRSSQKIRGESKMTSL